MSALEVHGSASQAGCDQVCGRAKTTPVAVHDGDACILSTDLNGSLRVIDADTATDGSAAKTKGPQAMAEYQASPATVHDGDAVPMQADSAGRLIVVDKNNTAVGAAAPTSTSLVGGVAGGTAAVHAGDIVGIATNTTGTVLVQDQGLNTTGSAAATTGPLAMGVAGGTAAVHAGDAVPLSVDTTGALNVASTTAAAFKTELGPYTYKHLAASGQVKNAAGFLHGVTFNTPATASIVTIYDNTGAAGDVIGIVTLDVGNLQPFFFPLNVTCATGIYINMSVAVDVTATYR
jgi:hypothetical protein